MAKQADGKDLAKHIYHVVHSQILSLELEPGFVFPEYWFEERFNASRTPILSALAHLQDNALVEKKRGRYNVSRIDTSAILELLYGRVATEGRILCDLMDRELPMLYEDLDYIIRKQRIVAGESVVDSVLFHDLDAEFHERIYKEAGFTHLCALFRDNSDYVRIKILDYRREQEYGRIIQEHQRILDDLSSHRRDAVSDDLRTHIYSHIAELIETCSEAEAYFK